MLKFVPPQVRDGKKIVKFKKDEVSEEEKKWDNAIEATIIDCRVGVPEDSILLLWHGGGALRLG